MAFAHAVDHDGHEERALREPGLDEELALEELVVLAIAMPSVGYSQRSATPRYSGSVMGLIVRFT
jgi:hypothetical protein